MNNNQDSQLSENQNVNQHQPQTQQMLGQGMGFAYPPQGAYYVMPMMYQAYPGIPGFNGQLPLAYGGAPPQQFYAQQAPVVTQNQAASSPAKSKKKKTKTATTGNQAGKEQSQRQSHAPWLKYKTTLCRHYEVTKTCSLGKMCSFAHGAHERRNINDPLPDDFPGRQNVGALLSNYKTQICRNFEETGLCKFSINCVYAHGKAELRSLQDPMPPVPSTVMLYNPPNAKMINASYTTHVPATHSQFQHPVPIAQPVMQQQAFQYISVPSQYHPQMMQYEPQENEQDVRPDSQSVPAGESSPLEETRE